MQNWHTTGDTLLDLTIAAVLLLVVFVVGTRVQRASIPLRVDQHPLRPKHPGNRGFTLVEMMIVIVVIAVLLAIGVPQFSSLIKNNRMLSLVYELRAVLNNARSEALAQRTIVTVCSSNNGTSCGGEWKDGYIVFRDGNGNRAIDSPAAADGDQIFLAKVLDVATTKFVYSNDPNGIQFDPRGYSTDSDGTFTICDDRGPADARGLILTPSGLVRAAEDPSKSGVMLDHAEVALNCD